jgi:uncharacterized protein (UPF0262 family)
MPLQAIALDERILQRGSEAQRIEWETNVRELLADAVSSLDPPARLRIGMTEREFILRFETNSGEELGNFVLAYELLAEQIADYIDVVRQITAADSLNQMEALDMAKKVTHDRAGRVIKRALRDIGVDLETSRRLFTLLLSLKVDTTRLPGVYGHRRSH